VDSLMEPEELHAREQERIQEELAKARTIEAMAERICKVISELTGNAVAVYLKSLKRVSFVNQLLEELVKAQKLADFLEDEPELFIDGTSLVFEQPEFQDLAKMRALLRMFDEKISFLQTLLGEHEEDAVHVRIGRENAMSSLGEVSLVTKDCHLGRAVIGGVAVVGPTRMDYPKVVAVVGYVADTVSDTLERF
jgi:heat-inducible transcriptional repressor